MPSFCFMGACSEGVNNSVKTPNNFERFAEIKLMPLLRHCSDLAPREIAIDLQDNFASSRHVLAARRLGLFEEPLMLR
jgi:hypothetical protein